MTQKIVIVVIVVITVIVVLITLSVLLFSRKETCEPWLKNQKSTCDKVAASLNRISNSLEYSMAGNSPSPIPISFHPQTFQAGHLQALSSNVDIPEPYKFNIKNINFDSYLSSAKFPIKIVYTTGYQSLQATFPIYSAGTGEVIPFHVILDTGSSELVLPTNICTDPQCTAIFGRWKAKENCEDYNIYNPTPVIPYGSGTVVTKNWTAPLLLDKNHAINLNFKGVTTVKNLNIPFFPSLCGLLPLYDKLSVSVIQQFFPYLTNCKQGFIMDLRPGNESITLGEINTQGEEVPLLTRDEYLSLQIAPADVKPIMYYAVKLRDVEVNGVSCGTAIPKYIILDTGTSGILTGIDEFGSSFSDFYNCINQNAKISFNIGTSVKLQFDHKVSDNNIQKSPDFASAGLLDTTLVGLPALIGTIISYDIAGKKLIFNQ